MIPAVPFGTVGMQEELFIFTIKDNFGVLLKNVSIVIYSDEELTSEVATTTTGLQGTAEVLLTPGTYWAVLDHAKVTFNNPYEIAVEEV